MALIDYTFDAALLLKDAGLVAADAAGTVAAVARILNIGTGRVDSRLILDVSAVEVATGDENYVISLQASTSPTFASGNVVLAIREIGDSSTLEAGVDSITGRYEVPFTNCVNGVNYPYIRVYCNVSGTIATGINFTAWLAKH